MKTPTVNSLSFSVKKSINRFLVHLTAMILILLVSACDGQQRGFECGEIDPDAQYTGLPVIVYPPFYYSYDGENGKDVSVEGFDTLKIVVSGGSYYLRGDGVLVFTAELPGTYQISLSRPRSSVECEVNIVAPGLDLVASVDKAVAGTPVDLISSWIDNSPAESVELLILKDGDLNPIFFIGTDRDRSSPQNFRVVPQETTTYIVRVKLAEVVLEGQVTVEVSDFIANALAFPGLVGEGETVQLSVQVIGGQPPYNYQWLLLEGESGPTNIANLQVMPVETSTYEVIVTDAYGLETRDTVTVEVQPPIPQITYTHQFCGPGPDQLTLRFLTDMTIEDGSQYQVLIPIGASEVAFTCVTDASAPDSLFCIGPGSTGGGLRTINLLNDLSVEPLTSTEENLIKCASAPTPRPPREEESSIGGGGECKYDPETHTCK
jgi:hypothetical protein